jgi:hypothetical protein
LKMRRKKEKKNNTPNQKVKNQIKGKKALKWRAFQLPKSSSKSIPKKIIIWNPIEVVGPLTFIPSYLLNKQLISQLPPSRSCKWLTSYLPSLEVN